MKDLMSEVKSFITFDFPLTLIILEQSLPVHAVFIKKILWAGVQMQRSKK